MALMTVEEIEEAAYRTVVANSPESTVYHSPEFLSLLRDVLDGARLVLLGLREARRLKGAIPCFIKEGKHGSVLNSLPFHGSIGGCLFESGEAKASTEDKKALLAGMTDLARDSECVSSTVISSPFANE